LACMGRHSGGQRSRRTRPAQGRWRVRLPSRARGGEALVAWGTAFIIIGGVVTVFTGFGLVFILAGAVLGGAGLGLLA